MVPDLETAFPSIRHQAVSMAGVLSLAVNSLENLAQLDVYFVFELKGEAFFETFHERFGTRFTPELEVLRIKLHIYLANSSLQFGLDPVLRVGDRSGIAEGVLTGSESEFTKDTESVMSAGPHRGSVGTRLSSSMSARAQQAKEHSAKKTRAAESLAEKTSMTKAAVDAQEPHHPVSPVRAQKKKGLLSRKTDCAIV